MAHLQRHFSDVTFNVTHSKGQKMSKIKKSYIKKKYAKYVIRLMHMFKMTYSHWHISDETFNMTHSKKICKNIKHQKKN